MLEQLLEKIGLDGKESAVYSALLAEGKSQALPLAKKVGLPRTTTLFILDVLIQKGLVTKVALSSKAFFVPAPPQSFKTLVQAKRMEVSELEENSSKLIELITPYFTDAVYKGPEIVFREGKKNVEKLLFLYQPKWRMSYKEADHFTMWGYQDYSFVQEYRRWHEHAWSTRNIQEKICLFSTEEGVSQQKSEKIKNREIRVLPKKFEMASSIWIHGTYVLIAQTRRAPHYALLIGDKMLAANLRIVFQLLWEVTS